MRELITPPFKGGGQAVALPDFSELNTDFRLRRVEGRHDVKPGLHRIGEAGGIGTAIDRQLGELQGLGRNQGQAFGVPEGLFFQFI